MSLFLSYSFGIETKKNVHTLPQFPGKLYPIPDQNGQNVYPFLDRKGAKTIPFGAAHTYMA